MYLYRSAIRRLPHFLCKVYFKDCSHKWLDVSIQCFRVHSPKCRKYFLQNETLYMYSLLHTEVGMFFIRYPFWWSIHIILLHWRVVQAVLIGYGMTFFCYQTCLPCCVGWSCLPGCVGWSCLPGCVGWSCLPGCVGWSCLPGCVGWSCLPGCVGWSCLPDCMGWSCLPCCVGWSCLPGCVGWSCLPGCVGWSCLPGCVGWSFTISLCLSSWGVHESLQIDWSASHECELWKM